MEIESDEDDSDVGTAEKVTFIACVQPGMGISKLYGELAARSCLAPFIGKMVEVTVRIKTWD